MIIFTEDRFEEIEELIKNINPNDDPINIKTIKDQILYQIKTHKIDIDWENEE